MYVNSIVDCVGFAVVGKVVGSNVLGAERHCEKSKLLGIVGVGLSSAFYKGSDISASACVHWKVYLADGGGVFKVDSNHGMVSISSLSKRATDVNLSSWCSKTPCNLAWAAACILKRTSKLRQSRLTSEN